jgi:transposase
MARRAQYKDWEIALAQELVTSARSVQQLRQGLSILIPVQTGSSIDNTAKLLGVRKSCVFMLRRDLRESGREVLAVRNARGGRRHQLLSAAQEAQFLYPFRTRAAQQGGIRLAEVHVAFERLVGKRVPRSTVFRLLIRQGWQASSTRPLVWRVPVDATTRIDSAIGRNLNATA